jgi:hypothetical protein
VSDVISVLLVAGKMAPSRSAELVVVMVDEGGAHRPQVMDAARTLAHYSVDSESRYVAGPCPRFLYAALMRWSVTRARGPWVCARFCGSAESPPPPPLHTHTLTPGTPRLSRSRLSRVPWPGSLSNSPRQGTEVPCSALLYLLSAYKNCSLLYAIFSRQTLGMHITSGDALHCARACPRAHANEDPHACARSSAHAHALAHAHARTRGDHACTHSNDACTPITEPGRASMHAQPTTCHAVFPRSFSRVLGRMWPRVYPPPPTHTHTHTHTRTHTGGCILHCGRPLHARRRPITLVSVCTCLFAD